jgi:hypothetical protein
LARPYKDAPARALVGDTIGGAGAGVAVDAANDLTGENGPFGKFNPTAKAVVDVMAPLAGGIGANAAQGLTEGVGGMLRNIGARTFSSAPSQIPLNPNTKAPYSIPDVDRAAATMKAGVSGALSVVARDIRENAAELTQRPITTPAAEPIVTAGGETGASIRRALDN